MWVVSVIVAAQLAASSGVAVWAGLHAESWPSRLVMAAATALMLAMTAGAVVRL
jgi:hypothetical protein